MRHLKAYLLTALFVMTAAAILAWYHTPSKLEDMDRMLYCACGYSKVQFKDGKITMIEYHHDTVKSGDVIGRYRATGNDVEMEIYFKGKTNVARYKADSIGILAPPFPGMHWEHQAFNSKALKLFVWRFLDETRRFLNETL
jgi:hypothetical protein